MKIATRSPFLTPRAANPAARRSVRSFISRKVISAPLKIVQGLSGNSRADCSRKSCNLRSGTSKAEVPERHPDDAHQPSEKRPGQRWPHETLRALEPGRLVRDVSRDEGGLLGRDDRRRACMFRRQRNRPNPCGRNSELGQSRRGHSGLRNNLCQWKRRRRVNRDHAGCNHRQRDHQPERRTGRDPARLGRAMPQKIRLPVPEA